MKYTYKVEEANFLNFQLYHMSQSEQFKAKIKKQPFFIMLTNLAIALFFGASKNYMISALFVVIGVLWYFLYPIRIKRAYESKLREEIIAKFKNHFGVEATFEINENELRTSDKGGFSDKKYSDIKSIIHLPTETLVIFKNQQTFILPKETTENFGDMKQELNKKAHEHQLKVEELPNWKW